MSWETASLCVYIGLPALLAFTMIADTLTDRVPFYPFRKKNNE